MFQNNKELHRSIAAIARTAHKVRIFIVVSVVCLVKVVISFDTGNSGSHFRL